MWMRESDWMSERVKDRNMLWTNKKHMRNSKRKTLKKKRTIIFNVYYLAHIISSGNGTKTALHHRFLLWRSFSAVFLFKIKHSTLWLLCCCFLPNQNRLIRDRGRKRERERETNLPGLVCVCLAKIISVKRRRNKNSENHWLCELG